ncbi:MAG TPA: hypothetical protein VFC60_01440 [Tissierellaceae bacterium]|nr:hypothetical protein [Tissierellaceae bacterium]
MKRKSKFITFLLSFIPGIAHFYLGLFERGLIFLFLFGGVSLGSIFMWQFTYWNGFVPLGLGGGAVVWLIALLDAFANINNMGYQTDMGDMEKEEYMEKTKKDNKRITTLALSIIPGAGHMYLGYQKKGLLFMAGFFFTIFFMGWLNLSLLVFILPLIWFYSFFDTYHTLNGKEVEDMDFESILPKIKHKYIGIGLIVIGILVIFQNMIFPIIQKYFIYEVKIYAQTTIVSLIFIIGGIKMLQKKKEVEEDMEIVEEEIEDEE